MKNGRLKFAEEAPIKDAPFPASGPQCQGGSALAPEDDLARASAKLIEDAVYPIEVKPVGNVVIKVGGVVCNAGEQNSHLRTYGMKADGKWRDDRKNSQLHRAPKPAMTFGSLLAKYEKLRRVNRR